MNVIDFVTLFAMLTLGMLLGCAAAVVFLGKNDDASALLTQAAAEQDAALMNYLDRSECNLLFNPVLSAWGLVDGKDTMIATAHSARVTLARAILADKKEAANVSA